MFIFPEEYNAEIYLAAYKDLRAARFSKEGLFAHFQKFGKTEGRTSNPIRNRLDFLPLIPVTAKTLEIGPFYNPVLTGPNVKYFDVLDHQQLRERARQHNYPGDKIPQIHFVDPKGDLGIIDEKFDVVVSSHNIEHQPDFVRHFHQIERLLKPGGYFFLMIPDKRYCFDHYMPETTIADVLCRYREELKTHYLLNVIEHRALTTHNDAARHWQGDHGPKISNFEMRYKAAVAEYEAAEGSYVDVHAYHFTPDSFAEIVATLRAMKLTNLSIVRNYHTRANQAEFFVIMEKVA